MSAPSAAHTVRAGDTLWAIAQRYGVTVDALRAANGLSGDLIHPGDKLTIPAGSSPSAPSKPTPARPKVSLARLVKAARTDPSAAQGHFTYKAGVLVVERALAAEGLLAKEWVDGHFGSKTVPAYSGWQQRLGYRGTAPGGAADGIPGKASLSKLGAKHGFDVTA
jgi:murein DD-endopeptidase MepM/ murein hydrolase activator NlpD